MNIGKYETLMAVVECGSLTRAAQSLGCTQSAVSHSIDSLEQELGFALLKRGRAGVRLTGEGERLIGAVRNLLNSAEQWAQTVASIRGLESGTVYLTAGERRIELCCAFSPRQRAILRAGGLLNYTKEGHD